MPSHYERLEVPPHASPEEIRTAFKRKAQALHPDKTGEAEPYNKLRHAYEVLRDPFKRQVYDHALGHEFSSQELQARVEAVMVNLVQQALDAHEHRQEMKFISTLQSVLQHELETLAGNLSKAEAQVKRAKQVLARLHAPKGSALLKALETKISAGSVMLTELKLSRAALRIVESDLAEWTEDRPADAPSRRTFFIPSQFTCSE